MQRWLLVFGVGFACGCQAEAPASDPSHPTGYYASESLPDRTAYLTFDDGPSQWTTDFLQILAQEDIKATFFINAFNTKGPLGLDAPYTDIQTQQHLFFRDALLQVVAAGHDLGNHTEHHKDLEQLDVATIDAELDGNASLIGDELIQAGGQPYPIRLIRPPFGSPWLSSTGANPQMETIVGDEIKSRGENILWNLDSTDSAEWADGEWFISPDPNPIHVYDPTRPDYQAKITRITNKVLQHALVQQHRGIVVLMHDTHPTTRDALVAIIEGLRAAGYSFGSLEAYIGCPRVPAPYDAAYCRK